MQVYVVTDCDECIGVSLSKDGAMVIIKDIVNRDLYEQDFGGGWYWYSDYKGGDILFKIQAMEVGP